MSKRKIIPGDIPTKDMHQYLLGSVAPRPIAFVSTQSPSGTLNLAPYSFFNAFSSNPPIVVFSSNRRVANNTTKDTLHNIMEAKECVISVVNYPILRQMALTSVEFPSDVSEFDQTGLTPTPSTMIETPGVLESPVNMECKVKDIITLGEHGGAGHLIICNVLCMHIDEEVLDGDRINPHKIDLMGRMGRSYYTRASGDAIMTVYQNVKGDPLTYPMLPDHIKKSTILTANDIAMLAALEKSEVDTLEAPAEVRLLDEVHEAAKILIAKGKVKEAYALLLTVEA